MTSVTPDWNPAAYAQSVPANLTPDYKQAEAKLRAAKTPAERRVALEEMLSRIPRHKGTEKLQADIKRRLARLRQAEQAQHAKSGHSFRIEPEGAAQVVLIGPPNAGKSSLLAATTHATPAIAEYPFTTTRPQPGMLRIDDVAVQLVDLPPITADHLDTWLPDVVRGADAALLLIDPTSNDCSGEIEAIESRLGAQRIYLVADLPEESDPRDCHVPTLGVITKCDLVGHEAIEAVRGRFASRFELVLTAIESGELITRFEHRLWPWLRLIRIYSKPPGKPVDRAAPFVLHEGATVHDLAERIHREIADHVRFARVWNDTRQGQRIGREDRLHDRDVIELHN